MNMFLLLSLFFVFCCQKTDSLPPKILPAFELQWASRIDYEKEVVGTDNTQHYKDWMLVGGDIGYPPTVMAFNKETGAKDWEYIHQGEITDEIDVCRLYGDLLVAMCSSGVFALDLETREVLWELDLYANNMTRAYEMIPFEGKLYLSLTKYLNTPLQESQIIALDPNTGAYDVAYASTEGTHSPVAFWTDPNSDRQLMLFNNYPNNGDPPEQTTQNVLAVDVSTGEVVWRVNEFTDFFSSNVLHPPIIYNKLVITGGDSSIYAFDIETGTLQWRFEMDYPWSIWNTTNHLIYNDRLYVNNGQEDVTCLNPLTGELIWNNPKGGANCTDNMVYYEKEDLLVFTSWGYGSVMILDALTGETVHREHRYDNSSYNNDVVYDAERDLFFTSTYKHAVAFKVRMPE